MGNARSTTDGIYASCLRPSWSYASALWSYLAFRRLISASQDARVTVRTISSADIQRCCLKQWLCPSYPITLESQWSNLLIYGCGVRWSAIGHELPQMNSACSLSNSPQRLLPLICTVTTATTSKSGSRETDLFFSLLFLKPNTLYYFSLLSLNYYALCTRK